MKLSKEQLKKDIDTILDMTERYHNVVWEPQEMQEDHFDLIPKAERVAIIGLYNDLVTLKNALLQYEHWFNDEN